MNRVFDQFETIAGFCRFPVGILGNPMTADFALVDLEESELPTDLTSGGKYFLGVLGIDETGGCRSLRVAFAEALDPDAAYTLTKAYMRHVRAKESSAPWRLKLDAGAN